MPDPARPLLVTDEPALLEEVVRVAATVGAELDVCPDLGTAAGRWSTAPAVLVAAAAARRPPRLDRRADVHLVSADQEDTAVWESAVRLGASGVFFLPGDEPGLTDLLYDLAEGRPQPAPLVGVIGGRGGAGATTLAAALGVAAARQGRRAVVVDADPLGGGLDLVLGGEDAGGLRWPDLLQTRGRVSGQSLVDALPRVGDLRLLSWDRAGSLTIPVAAMDALLPAAQRGAELVVVDLPRRLDDAARAALRRITVVLLVVPADLRSTAAAARVAAALAVHCSEVRVVVRGPAPGRLSAEQIATSLGFPLAALLRPEPGLAGALERGEPPGSRSRGPLARFSTRFLAALPRAWSEAA